MKIINFWKISIFLNFWRKILRIFFQFKLFSIKIIFTYWLIIDVQYRCKRQILFLLKIECVLHILLYVFKKFETFFSLNEKTFWMSKYEKFKKKFIIFRLIRFFFNSRRNQNIRFIWWKNFDRLIFVRIEVVF